MAGEQMRLRREGGLPAGPPQVGLDEVLLEEATGRAWYKKSDGTLGRLDRPGFGFFIGSFSQDGFATVPIGDVIENDFGGAPVWGRDGVGRYRLDFGAVVMSEDFALAFATIRSSSAAKYLHARVDAGQSLILEFFDAAGVLVEADCSFAVLVYSYALVV